MAALSQTAASVLMGAGATTKVVTAGGTITAGMPCYMDVSDSNKYKAARANASGTSVVAGIALHGASAGQPLSIQTSGEINLGATLTVGETYVLSDAVAGQIIPCILGVARTAALLPLTIIASSVAKA